MEQLKTIGRELAGTQGGFGQSKEFLDLVKSIGESRSKSEEDRIVPSEIETLRRRLSDPDIPKRKIKDYIVRLGYVEMLGNDASFRHIYAIKMTDADRLEETSRSSNADRLTRVILGKCSYSSAVITILHID